jgi:hypothetical protein
MMREEEEEDDTEGLTDAEILDRAKAMALASLDLDAPPAAATSYPILSHSTSASFPQLSLSTVNPIILEEIYDPPPTLPSVSLLIDLDDTTIILDVLEHFRTWLEERQAIYQISIESYSKTFPSPASSSLSPGTTKILLRPSAPVPTAHELSWILSLLSSLTFLLCSDDISILRSLCRTLLTLSALSEKVTLEEEAKGGKIGRTREEIERDEEEAEGRAACWMIVTVVCDVWGQKDLWNGD